MGWGRPEWVRAEPTGLICSLKGGVGTARSVLGCTDLSASAQGASAPFQEGSGARGSGWFVGWGMGAAE